MSLVLYLSSTNSLSFSKTELFFSHILSRVEPGMWMGKDEEMIGFLQLVGQKKKNICQPPAASVFYFSVMQRLTFPFPFVHHQSHEELTFAGDFLLDVTDNRL